MGLYNELNIPEPTDHTSIQFKFGELWNYAYIIGGRIRPSNDPRTSEGRFEVSGIASFKGDHTQCRYFSIVIEDGILISAREIDEDTWDILDREDARPCPKAAGDD